MRWRCRPQHEALTMEHTLQAQVQAQASGDELDPKEAGKEEQDEAARVDQSLRPAFAHVKLHVGFPIVVECLVPIRLFLFVVQQPQHVEEKYIEPGLSAHLQQFSRFFRSPQRDVQPRRVFLHQVSQNVCDLQQAGVLVRIHGRGQGAFAGRVGPRRQHVDRLRVHFFDSAKVVWQNPVHACCLVLEVSEVALDNAHQPHSTVIVALVLQRVP
eukprot:2833078-Rhodomonas_salina.1